LIPLHPRVLFCSSLNLFSAMGNISAHSLFI
jgi:hypothetical protein